MGTLEKRTFEQRNLVLKVSESYNPVNLNIEEWEPFLLALCGNRNFQIESIKTSVIYLCSQNYDSIKDLVAENFDNNTELQAKFNTIERYYSNLQLPNQLSANIDLATGTGKSFVMYGIARIMLAIGKCDRVLVLCPSLTIEAELKNKFTELFCRNCLYWICRFLYSKLLATFSQ